MAAQLKNPVFLATTLTQKSLWRCNELNYLGGMSTLRQATTL